VFILNDWESWKDLSATRIIFELIQAEIAYVRDLENIEHVGPPGWGS